MEWILSSSALILIVIGLRVAFRKKVSRGFRFILWLPVVLRLLIPFSFTKADWFSALGEPVRTLLAAIWCAGAVIVLTAALIQNLVFFAKLRRSRRMLNQKDCSIPVYHADAAEVPCLFGLFRPAVYLTTEAMGDGTMRGHVIARAEAGSRRLDPVWAVLRCVCLAVHWWNPLVWWAAWLSRADALDAANAAALARLGYAERGAYAKTLSRMEGNRPSLLLISQ